MKRTQLTVGDLYCGAGGFSEGFRQAGFKILWGVDNWGPAATTFANNFSEAEVLTDDVLSLDLRRLDPVDVLIGSPPCTHFSLANKGGNGDVVEGLRLVRRFMDAVDVLRPRYYVMENVPHLSSVLEQTISDSVLRRYFPQKRILDSADFGVPQSRRRFFLGKFPRLQIVTADHIPMRRVVYGLPYPMAVHSAEGRSKVRDPLYGFTISISKLTDHFMQTALDRTDIQECLREKQRHPWYGRMRFPDSLDLPARTLDTNTALARRQSIVIVDSRGGSKVHRGLTTRERACLQGFPITHQFWGEYLTYRFCLVGNAVPPPVARAMALAMREEMGMPLRRSPTFNLPDVLPPVTTSRTSVKPKYRFPLTRHYRWYVPGTLSRVRRVRVDFDNLGKAPARHPGEESQHLVEWRSVLYLGYARDYVGFKLDATTACRIAKYVCLRTGHRRDIVERVVSRSCKDFPKAIPDASTLQAIWAGRISGSVNPDRIVVQAAHTCKQAGVVPRTKESGILAGECEPFLDNAARVSRGKDWRQGIWKKARIDLYTASASVAVSIAALIANRGVVWLRSNWGKHYAGQPLDLPESRPSGMRGVTSPEIESVLLDACRSLSKSIDSLVMTRER
jgi:DNA-cytosine methyltransferase